MWVRVHIGDEIMELAIMLFLMVFVASLIVTMAYLLTIMNKMEGEFNWIYSVCEMSQSHPGSEFQALREISEYIEEHENPCD